MRIAEFTPRFLVVKSHSSASFRSGRLLRIRRHSPPISRDPPAGILLYQHERPRPALFKPLAPRHACPSRWQREIHTVARSLEIMGFAKGRSQVLKVAFGGVSA